MPEFPFSPISGIVIRGVVRIINFEETPMHSEAGNQTTGPYVVQFNRRHPPPSEEVALARLDQLDSSAAHLETQLDFTNPRSYKTEEQYEAWRRRAIAALSYVRQEWTFLESWVIRLHAPAHQMVLGADLILDPREETAKDVRARACHLATAIGGAYAERYTATELPQSRSEASERMAYLKGLHLNLEAALSEVGALWRSSSLRNDQESGMKLPLVRILMNVQVERNVLKEYLKAPPQRACA